MESSTSLHIIYTKAEMLLSRRTYGSWREIQGEYTAYKASLGPWPADEVVEYLADEYPNLSPSAPDQVAAFLAGSAETHTLTFGGG